MGPNTVSATSPMFARGVETYHSAHTTSSANMTKNYWGNNNDTQRF